MKTTLIAITTLTLNTASASIFGTLGGWDAKNDPRTFNQPEFNSLTLEYRLNKLKTTGEIKDHIAWSDSYWPSNLGGIAFRWNHPRAKEYIDTRVTDAASLDLRNELGFTYKLYSKKEVQLLTYDQLAALSPAEKYDIFMGNYKYPTVKLERSNKNPNQPYWFGICDGWTPAALNHTEPAAINIRDANGVVRNQIRSKDGILIPFGSADVKALLGHYYNRTHEQSREVWLAKKRFKIANAALVGQLCRTDITKVAAASDLAECADTNAGAFHITMANQLGQYGRGFGIDVDSGVEIWNQPVFAYDSQIIGQQRPSPGAAPGTVSEVIVQTDLYYSDDTFRGKAYWDPVIGTENFFYDVAKYQYRLELDAAGKVVGGEWMKRDRSADFSWLDAVDRTSKKYLMLNDYERPGFRREVEMTHNRPDQLWIQRVANFKEGFDEYYEGINRIYRPAKAGPISYRDLKPGYVTEHEEWEAHLQEQD